MKTYTADEGLAMRRQSAIVQTVLSHAHGGIKTAVGVKALANAMFATAKNENLPESQMSQALALLSGMACGALCRYGDLLAEQEANEAYTDQPQAPNRTTQ